MIQLKGRTIGAVWIELEDTKYVNAPALHIMIGNPDSRGMGTGKLVMEAMINYAFTEFHTNVIYSRHLTSNDVIARVTSDLGFAKDGAPYAEENGLIFQNIKLERF
ncbi:GNAT family N-acetyltransferase [Candidatus Saccharibacteria bacterium]|nr:GNAT family N-acetyltransferase [Candidatus Saccharibacteria bacterium]